ncbi:VOC family protein [Solwaraspora sp. WMMB335]|uniref:VOC family protein n=1 Tax=Solwaraspora sp. WMMB335 TaxID=3404118 RepID=UPI003B925008
MNDAERYGRVRIRGYAPGTPCWSELVSNDPASSIEFYHELFAWKPVDRPASPGHVDFHLRNMAVAGLAPTVTDQQPSAWLTYLATDDVPAAVDAITGAGGQVAQPPTGYPGRGAGALVADPQGAVFGLWQRGPFPGAQVSGEPGATCWNELAVRDTASAAHFYGGLFGWTTRASIYSDSDSYREWLDGSREIAGLIEMGELYPPQVPAHWRTTFEVDDCPVTVGRCRELGGQVSYGPVEVGPGSYAQLTDPQGAAFGIIALLPEFRAPMA